MGGADMGHSNKAEEADPPEELHQHGAGTPTSSSTRPEVDASTPPSGAALPT
jgi:hypothetical protein